DRLELRAEALRQIGPRGPGRGRAQHDGDQRAECTRPPGDSHARHPSAPPLAGPRLLAALAARLLARPLLLEDQEVAMKTRRVKLPVLGAIAATRGMIGLGAGLLLSSRM